MMKPWMTVRTSPPNGPRSLATISGGGADAAAQRRGLVVDDACGGIPAAELTRVFEVAFRAAGALAAERAAGGAPRR
jgi:hypothetical protein